MRNIGFCIDSLEMGGAEKLLVDIIELLYTTGRYNIFLLTKTKSDSYFYNKIKDKVNYFYLISKEDEEKYKKYSFVGKFLTSIIKKKNFKKFSSNVEILIDFLDGDFCKYIKLEKQKEKIIWLHLNYERLVKEKKLKEKIKYYSKIIVTTEEMYNRIKKEEMKSMCNKKIYMIYNFIDFKKIDNMLLEKNIEKLEEENYFLTVCRLDEKQKDVSTLIKAFSLYKGDEKLYIIGDGESRTELEKLAKELKIFEKIRFLGIQNNPYIYMANSKAFILSSKAEGFGLVVAEALYCGTKVIASDCDYGPREILLNGEIGELFKVGDEKYLLEKLNNINNYNYSKEKIRISLRRFDKKEILRKMEKIFND
ncbi:glycosyltransferase [Fusobacterium perfoetens]|uniref:glycosyltransferase n=1 Tax=Fusobacterium perfoetens TaxID=852 RepID=UPI0026E9E3B9|nr:glycosyltransferase [Fusobacterium perfoetens]